MINELNILFIGNSYTNYNSLTKCFEKIVFSNGLKVNTIKLAYGNQFIHNYINCDQGNHFNELQEIVQNNKIDYAFIQGQSREPIVDYKDFSNSIEILINYLKNFNITPVIYQTWGYPVGYLKLMNEIGCENTIDMQKKLALAYQSIADKFNLKVSPVGKVFSQVFINHPEKTDLLYANNENSHPSSIGTYLAALSHFAAIYNLSPLNIKYTYNDYANDNDIVWHVEKVNSISDQLQKELEETVNQIVLEK